MMPFLILRRHRTSEEVELAVENVETLSIKELRENAATKLKIPLEELSKMTIEVIPIFVCFNIQNWCMVAVY